MPTARLVPAVILIAALAACGEKPQNTYVSNERAEVRDQQARLDAQRQRTLGQSEGDRIYNNGTLR